MSDILTLDDILLKQGLTILFENEPLGFKIDKYQVPWAALDVLCGEEKMNFTYEQVINFNWKEFSDNHDKIIRSAMVNTQMKTWHKYCNQPSKIIDLYNNPKDKINESNILNNID